jgi:hypothetical protein
MALKGSFTNNKKIYDEAYIKIMGFGLNVVGEYSEFKYGTNIFYNIYADSDKDVLLKGESIYLQHNEVELSFEYAYLQLKNIYSEMIDC